jgi:hypothetical protein
MYDFKPPPSLLAWTTTLFLAVLAFNRGSASFRLVYDVIVLKVELKQRIHIP